MKIILYTDGGARGNPGPAGIGGQLLQDTTVVAEFSEYVGKQTNNWAEYEALIHGLDLTNQIKSRSQTSGLDQLEVKMDSELIVKQMRGEYRVKDAELKKQHAKVNALLDQLALPVTFSHVRREKNKEADRLVNEAIDGALADDTRCA